MKIRKNRKQSNNKLFLLRKKIMIQGGIAVSTVALVLVLVFTMSAAWYTNVVKSSNLIFQTAVWGFQGEVDIGDDAIVAGPGKSGVIDIEVNNNGTDMIFAGVHIDKAMEEDLSKRIYLYVDAASTKNGEFMERVYLNSKESYSYLVPSQNKLILREQYYNDARVMWSWVYDVVGYYFLGTVNQSVTAEEEYLRPVEYNLDAATFSDSGKLLTVDGSTTVAEFLQDLSARDGYPGVIDTAAAVNGYYPVDVDGNGNGIWLYLCNWAEIQQETEIDVALGSAPEKKTGIVRLTISAQGGQFETTEVSTVTELEQALNNAASGVVQLNGDIHLNEGKSILLNNIDNAVLNLNGHTISMADANPAIQVTGGSKLTVFGGELEGSNASGSTAVKVSHGELTMNKVNVSGVVDAITIADHTGSGQDSMVRLSECSLSGTDCAMFLKGNGGKSGQMTQITIEKSTLHGDMGAIWGSGNDDAWGTSIQILDSTLTGGDAAIYHPQRNSRLDISGSTLHGKMGIAVKGGDIHLKDCTVTATGEGDPSNLYPGVNGSGCTDTGAAIYLETNYNYGISVTVEGTGTTVISENDLAVRVNLPDASNAIVEILGGTFSSDVSKYVPEGHTVNTAGGKWVVS